MTTAPTVQSSLIRAFSRNWGERCLVWEGGQATYGQTAQRVAALATWLQQTTPSQAHIAILLANCREYVEVLLACMAAGRVRVALNLRDPIDQQLLKVDQADARVIFTDSVWWERLHSSMQGDLPTPVIVGARVTGQIGFEELVSGAGDLSKLNLVDPESRSRLTYTGGTTGTPKAVVVTQARELAAVRNLAMEVVRPNHQTVFVACTPLSHASGAFLMPTLLGGGGISWTDGFQPDRLASSDWLGPDVHIQTFLVPTGLDDLSNALPTGRHQLDTVVYGGAPCPARVLEGAIERGMCLVGVYGQAEAPMTICVLQAAHHRDPSGLAGCVGYPFFFVDVRLAKEGGVPVGSGQIGEVLVRSDHVMLGYWKNEAATTEAFTPDGYLRTQDLGYFDEAGRLVLVGRSREMIISGGYNVYPAEVERRLGHIAGIRDLAIFGVTHRRWGEGVVAAVIPDGPKADDESLTQLVDNAARERLANFERPKAVVVVERIPKTPVGKVSRRDLAEQFSDLFANH